MISPSSSGFDKNENTRPTPKKNQTQKDSKTEVIEVLKSIAASNPAPILGKSQNMLFFEALCNDMDPLPKKIQAQLRTKISALIAEAIE